MKGCLTCNVVRFGNFCCECGEELREFDGQEIKKMTVEKSGLGVSKTHFMVCSKCPHKVRHDSNYCPFCGANLKIKLGVINL